MNTWPATLQQALNEGSFNFDIGDTTLVTDMDVGPKKKRSRSTKGIDTFNGSINLHKSLYGTLEDFYKTTSANGTLPFTFTHPIYLTSTTCRFREPPKISRLGGEYFSVSLSLEIMP